jgi:hypothetical protein
MIIIIVMITIMTKINNRWSAKGFQGHTGHDDAWWVHNKKHSTNTAY